MGFISNQWLNRGLGLRNRKYSPVKMRILAEAPDDSWSENHRIAVRFNALREGGEFQILHLDRAEAELVVRPVLAACSNEVRTSILQELLHALPDAELLEALSIDLSNRVEHHRSR